VEFPEVRYADADGVAIAYAVSGAGPVDLVRLPGLMSGILAGTVDPVFLAHYEQLAQFSRLIVIDRRGQGLSDPSVTGGAPLWEQQVQDIRAVLDAVGAEQVALLGAADGGSVAVLFAAMYPERVSALVLYGAWVRFGGPDSTADLDPVVKDELQRAMRVLFTDIVGSTERLARVGDQEWRFQLDQHDAAVREQLRRFGGREVSTSGDGFFATFDGPAKALGCARAIIESAGDLAIEVRAGVHAGECEVRGDDLGGIAVHLGARVCATAVARQVLTTSTVRDLVAGSGIAFADHGLHDLKGIPELIHLYIAT
jgi:class 3 adenylate cyclase